jgi:hypothetical protein
MVKRAFIIIINIYVFSVFILCLFSLLYFCLFIKKANTSGRMNRRTNERTNERTHKGVAKLVSQINGSERQVTKKKKKFIFRGRAGFADELKCRIVMSDGWT